MHDLPTLQAVIFDLDGTLVDSAEDIRAAATVCPSLSSER